MRGIKGTVKMVGDPCAKCHKPITQENAVPRALPRKGLLPYCKPCRNKRSRDQHQKNPERRREVDKRHRDYLKETVIKGYGGKCKCCGESTPEFLAIDHVNGGGNVHRKTVTSPTEMRRLVIKLGFPKEYRLLCHNCNTAMAWFGSCPHAKQS